MLFAYVGAEMGPSQIFFEICPKKFFLEKGKNFLNSQLLCCLSKKYHGSHPRDPCKVSLASYVSVIDFFYHKSNEH